MPITLSYIDLVCISSLKLTLNKLIMTNSDKVIQSFLDRKSRKISNDRTDGTNLYYRNNLIATFVNDKLHITDAGWKTRTTKDRLNSLPNVSIYQKNFDWYLNGQMWDGKLTKVDGYKYDLQDLEEIKGENV